MYAFFGGKEFLYIGKASNLRERVKNHFRQPSYRDGFFLEKVSRVDYVETDSEIEALILEANLIKKYQPKYNVIWRDDKNYFYIGVSKEDFPRVYITHQPDATTKKVKNKNLKPKIAFIGPFVEGGVLKKTLTRLRRVFPHYTVRKHPKGNCPWCHLGLCPGPDANKKEYQKNIRNLISVLKGKRKVVLLELKKEMKKTSLREDYEEAAKIRDQILALEKIISHTKIFDEISDKYPPANDWKKTEKNLKKLFTEPRRSRGEGEDENAVFIAKRKKPILKMEAYDVSNIQGKFATGAMVSFLRGKPDKNFYRKFKIRISNKPDDIAMLKEVLSRRLKHIEWPYPTLFLIDGGKAQLNAALNVLSRHKSAKSALINVLALAKKENKLFVEGRKNPVLLKSLSRDIFNLILQLRDEAHRFAISYHKKLRLRELTR